MSGLSSVYPLPPNYYKYFTSQNLDELKKVKSFPDGEEKTTKLAEAPLQFLVPPEPPTETYSSFGSIWQVDDKLLSLSEAGVTQLYNDFDKSDESVQSSHQSRIWELKKLLKSMLLNFLELIKILSLNPEKFPQKVEDIRIILINMHHLLNEYRPHQSRDSLILLMEDQIQRVQEEIRSIKASNDKIRGDISSLAEKFSSMDCTVSTGNGDSVDSSVKLDLNSEQKDQRLWSLI